MALVPFPGAHAGALKPRPDDEGDDQLEGKMSFLEHLDELRKRIVNSCIAIGVGVCVELLFHRSDRRTSSWRRRAKCCRQA